MAERGRPRNISVNNLREATLAGDWPTVSEIIQRKANDLGFVSWACEAMYDEDPKIREVGAGIFQVTNYPLTPPFRNKLTALVADDPEFTVRFAAAGALFHNNDRSEEVLVVLRAALNDPLTQVAAQAYLDQLNP